MLVRVYEIADHDVMQTFFGEESPDRPVATLGHDHGELIFEGNMTETPIEGDVLLLPDGNGSEGGGDAEYVILVKVYHAVENEVEIVVHRRHFEGASS